MFGGWRGFRRFWVIVVVIVAVAAGTLQLLGPPRLAMVAAPAEVPPLHPLAPPMVVHQPPPALADHGDKPGRDVAGPVNDPDPALLEPSPHMPSDTLPRIALDGRKPMQFYAAGFDPTSTRPRVGILIAGIGLSAADSKKAITDLPSGVSFAISPYTASPEPLLSSVRLAGHEYLLSLPMEPLRFPLQDAGPNAMLTTLSPRENQPRLLWALSRLQGYAGATDILGAMRGERLADMPEQMTPILAELNRRGLMYVAAPGQASPVSGAWSKAIDLVIDDPANAESIDARLTALEGIARDRGSALGLIEAPRPVTVERLAAWSNGLIKRGLTLAPVSALMLPPKDQPK